MKLARKICVIYATPPNNTKNIVALLSDTDYIVSEGYDYNGHYRFEVFEEFELEDLDPTVENTSKRLSKKLN